MFFKDNKISKAIIRAVIINLRSWRESHEEMTIEQETFLLYTIMKELGIKTERVEMPIPPKSKSLLGS